MHRFSTALLLALGAAPAAAAQTNGFPVTVESCGREVTVEAAPERAVAHGSNLVEIMLALGLEDRMTGFMGRIERVRAAVDMFPAAATLRAIQSGYPTMEVFLEEEIDFYFAGWSYGMRVGGEVTPDSLAAYGVPVYELSESCVRLGRAEPPTFEYLYRDLRSLAAIFGAPDRAEALIAGYEQRLAAVADRVSAVAERPTVFIYDSGDKAPLSAGGYSMPQAIIDAAGGVNLIADLESSWVRLDWETVVERDPDLVVIVDYDEVTAEEKIAFMKDNPAFGGVGAVRDDRFLVLSYDDLTPGPRNISAVERLSAFLFGG